VKAVFHTDDPGKFGNPKECVIPEGLPGLSIEETREIGKQITVAIPYRSSEGIAAGICTHFPIWAGFGIQIAEIRDPHGGFIEIVRAGIVRVFLDQRRINPERKFLVMIDNDEAVEWDAPLRLARHNLPVVTGVVCSMSDEKGIFACFTVKQKNGEAYFPTTKKTGVMPAQGLVEVHQTGTGLLCVRYDVFEKILDSGAIPFYIPEELRKQSALTGDLHRSEDITFADACDWLGIKRYADLSVQAKHQKLVSIMWPKDLLDPNLSGDDWVIKNHREENANEG
jgi:hypothetical protein